MKGYNLSILVFLLFFAGSGAKAQTYSTPELKEKVEREMKIKNISYNIIQPEANTLTDIYTPVTEIRDLNNLFILKNTEIIDEKHAHTLEELIAFNDELSHEREYENIFIDLEQQLVYTINIIDNVIKKTEHFYVKENSLIIDNCRKCSSSIYQIIESTNSSLILESLPQDEGRYFVYRFSFIK